MSASKSNVLQKSKVAGLKIFHENIKQRAIADSYDLNRITEVACEFCVRPRGLSHLVHESRAYGPQNFGHRRKSTFATQSSLYRKQRCRAWMSVSGPKADPLVR
jgi:hypothetical protein